METVAIIPAFNEAPRIERVIDPVLRSGAVTRVVVVDDGSTDDTAQVAVSAGASVYRLRQNQGKGRAMRAAVQATDEPVVLFLDADLTGLTPGSVIRLVEPVEQGRCVMTVGLRDYGAPWNRLQMALPRITGERAVLRTVLNKIPAEFWDGFKIEAGMNEIAARAGDVCDVMMWGVAIVPKWEKENPSDGFIRAAKMTQEVLIALAKARQIP